MKQIFGLLSVFAAAVLVFSSCTEGNTDGDGTLPKFDIEIVPEWDISNGITSSSQTARFRVECNYPTINWQVSSDSQWCRVDAEAIHTGSADIEMVVDANNAFDKRSAILTFTAGFYTRTVEIDQAGNIFILSDIYKVMACNESASFDIEVKAKVAWDIVTPDWITAEKSGDAAADGDGMTSTTVHVTIGENPNAEYRYGGVQFVPEEGYADSFDVFQFGSDVRLTDDGKMDISAEGNVTFELMAPFGVIEAVETPYWIEYTASTSAEGDDAIYNFRIGRNISDTNEPREAVIKLALKDRDAKVELPAVRQDFIPAGGIVTGRGLNMFAEAYNAGADVSSWATGTGDEMVVNVLSDVHMEELETWTPIGTAERPFVGEFNGNGWLIENWKGSAPMFGHTGAGADIHNVIINTTSSFTFSGSFSSETYLAPFVGVHRGLLRNCTNRAPVNITAIESIAVLGFGGIAGKVEGGRIESCSNEGAVTAAASVASSKDFYLGGIAAVMSGETSAVRSCVNGAALSDYALISETSSNLYVGGIAALASGEISNCSTSEKPLTVATNQSRSVYVGGIAAYSTAKISDCTNNSTVSTSFERNGDAVRAEQMAGIVAWQKGDVTGCANRGALISSSNHKFFFAGGICGSMIEGVMSGNSNSAKIDVMGVTNNTIAGVRYLTAGGIAGALYAKAKIVGEKETVTTGAITVMAMESSGASRVSVGGIVGQLRGSVEGVVNGMSISIPTSFVSTGWAKSSFSFGGIAGIVSEYSLESDEEVKKQSHAYITDCNNIAALMWLRNSPNMNSSPVYMGGILGFATTDVSVTVARCNNTAKISNLHYNNEYLWTKFSNAAGGIVGAHDGADETRKVIIEECNNSGSVNLNRTNAGGIAGYMNHGEIISCRNTGGYDSGGNDTRRSRSGGIVGEAYNTLMSDCVNRAKLYAQYTGGSVPCCGGIAAVLGGGSVIDGCRHFGEISAQENASERYLGGLAGRSEVGSTIKGSGFGGTIDGSAVTLEQVCGDKNFTVPVGADNYIWNGAE